MVVLEIREYSMSSYLFPETSEDYPEQVCQDPLPSIENCFQNGEKKINL